MGKCIQIGNRRFVLYPHSFLSCVFEMGIVTFTFCAQGITAFEISAVPVNGKPQVNCKYAIFSIYTVFSAIIKTGTSSSIKLFDLVVNVFSHHSPYPQGGYIPLWGGRYGYQRGYLGQQRSQLFRKWLLVRKIGRNRSGIKSDK